MAAANPAATAITDFGQYSRLRAAAQRKDPAALRQAAQQFEALFTEMMLKTAHETRFGDDLTGSQGDVYKDLLDQQLAVHLSAGKGLGLADMLVRQLGGVNAPSTPSTQAVPTVAAHAAAATAGDAHPSGASWRPKSAQEFVDAVRSHAERAAAELGVPARALIAQAALETGWGQHLLHHKDGTPGYNLFGIKASAGGSGASLSSLTGEYRDGKPVQEQADFRAYQSIGAAFDDYVGFLKSNPRYAAALRSGDVHAFAHALQQAGYATDPHYSQKLIKVAYGAQMNAAYAAPRTTTV